MQQSLNRVRTKPGRTAAAVLAVALAGWVQDASAGEKPQPHPAHGVFAAGARSNIDRPLAIANAVRDLPGFRTNVIPANDDGSGPLVPIGFTINFFGRSYTHCFVNNNGNLTFDRELPTYTPFPLTGTQQVIIAPFFADVDTRGQDSRVVTFGNDTVNGRPAFGANYINVGYFSAHTDKLNSFQVILIDRSDVRAGDFDIEFNYNTVRWETGDASGGVGGFGGVPVRVGYSNGSGDPGTFFELPGSAEPGAFLDSNSLTGLANNGLNSEVLGRYVYTVRGGFVETVDLDISSVDFPDPAVAGFELRYFINVKNNGPAEAAGVLLRNTLPAGAIFVSATTSQGTCRGGTTLVCSLGRIANGATATVEVVMVPTGPGELTSGAAVFSFQPDANITNNSARNTVTRVECRGPAVRYMSPSRVTAGSGAFQMLINGICLTPGAVLRFNGSPRTTEVLTTSLVRASITAADVAQPRDVQITVFADNRQSAASQFRVVSEAVPSLSSQGVVNAASFQATAFAANSILSVFGTGLATQTLTASSLPLPRTLGGVTVYVNSYAAPLLYVSPTQINFLMPFEVLGLGDALITVVTSGGVTTNGQEIQIGPASPAIFTMDSAGQGAVIISATGEVAAPSGAIPGRSSRPARRGEFISIFATGLGTVTIQPASGAAVPAGTISRAIFNPTVTIADTDAQADFAGLAPGLVGVYQINVRIPDTITPGSAVSLKIAVSDAVSNTVTIAVE